MLESDALVRGMAALRRLNSNGGFVRLFRTAADKPFVLVSDHGVRDTGRIVYALIDGYALNEVSWPELEGPLRRMGWSVEVLPTDATGARPSTHVSRTYLVSSDADLVRIASDAHAALDFLLPEQFGQPLDGARFGPSSDSGMALGGYILSVPSMLLGLVVGSIILLIWFPSDWEDGPAWAAAILGTILGAFVIPSVLLTATNSSDRLHDAAETARLIGLVVLPAAIAGIVLVVATTAF